MDNLKGDENIYLMARKKNYRFYFGSSNFSNNKLLIWFGAKENKPIESRPEIKPDMIYRPSALVLFNNKPYFVNYRVDDGDGKDDFWISTINEKINSLGRRAPVTFICRVKND